MPINQTNKQCNQVSALHSHFTMATAASARTVFASVYEAGEVRVYNEDTCGALGRVAVKGKPRLMLHTPRCLVLLLRAIAPAYPSSTCSPSPS